MESRLVNVGGQFKTQAILGRVDSKPIEGVVRDIVRLFRENPCYNRTKERRLFVEVLACFHARMAMVQSPIRFGPSMSEDDYKNMLDTCVQHLIHCDCPAQETIQLQVTTQGAIHRSLEALVNDSMKDKQTLERIMDSVLEVTVVDSRKLFESVEILHIRVLEYLVECSRQIDPHCVEHDPSLNEVEVLAALESVMPRKGLLYWMDLPREERLSQVEELADIVMGIRVFNKCLGKGGNILQLPYARFEIEVDSLREKLQESIQNVNSRVDNYVMGVQMFIEEMGAQHIFILRLRDELAYYIQAAEYLESIDQFLIAKLKAINDLSERCALSINKLNYTISCRECIPAELVFPELQKIGRYQKNTLEEYNLLQAHANATTPLLALAQHPAFVPCPMGVRRLQIKAKNFLFLPREATKQCPIDNILEYGGPRATLVDDQDVEHYCNNLEYGGFCAVTLVQKEGLLRLGDSKIGLVQVDDKIFSFVDEEALKRFLKAPQAYIEGVCQIVLKMPQLIHILGLHRTEAYSYVSIPMILQKIKESLPSDFGVQTCVHAIPEHQWDEETLQKRVQELAKMKTDSTQTKDSHFHRTSITQVWPMKDKSTQTGVSRGTTMARHVRVLHNLRGDLHENVKIVKATFEMTETVDPL